MDLIACQRESAEYWNLSLYRTWYWLFKHQNYPVAGTGSGTMTVWLFCVVAIELKHRAPKAHTFLEIIKIRWGTACHFVSIPVYSKKTL